MSVLDEHLYAQLNEQQREWYHHYYPLFAYASDVYDVPLRMLLRLAWKESKFNPRAVSLGREPSPDVAQGIMQIIPKFHPNVFVMVPASAIQYATEWLRNLYDEFGSWRKAVAAYNWGPVNVRGGSYVRDGVRITVPAWDGARETTRDETRQYLDMILGEGWAEPIEDVGFSVGPGIEHAMRYRADIPATDEIYTGDSVSHAWGTSGRMYTYIKSLNQVMVYAPETMAKTESWSPKDRRGELSVRLGVSRYGKRSSSGIDSIDVHYTASPATGTVESIARYQTGPNAQEQFPAIAYHLVVDNLGVVHWCHDLDTRTWHNGGSGRNDRAIGLCWIGDTVPNERQIEGLKRAVRWCREQLARDLVVQGHRDTHPTQCPGNRYKEWIGEIS